MLEHLCSYKEQDLKEFRNYHYILDLILHNISTLTKYCHVAGGPLLQVVRLDPLLLLKWSGWTMLGLDSQMVRLATVGSLMKLPPSTFPQNFNFNVLFLPTWVTIMKINGCHCWWKSHLLTEWHWYKIVSLKVSLGIICMSCRESDSCNNMHACRYCQSKMIMIGKTASYSWLIYIIMAKSVIPKSILLI